MTPKHTEPRSQSRRAGARRPIAKFLMLDILWNSHSRPLMVYAGTVVAIGTIVYHFLEGWTYFDAFYFVVITLTTIGYGDLTPTSHLSKFLTVFYALNGIAILFALFDEMRRVRHRAPGQALDSAP